MLTTIGIGLSGLVTIIGGIAAWAIFRRSANNTPEMRDNATGAQDTLERAQAIEDVEKADTENFTKGIGE